MNFALILFILTVITGIFWIFERTVFLPQRRRKAEEAASAFEAANREAAAMLLSAKICAV